MRAASFVLGLLTGFLIGACSGRPPEAPKPDPAPSALADQTVALVAPDGEGHIRAYCSGVWVSSQNILTAKHCIEDWPEGLPVFYATRKDVAGDQVIVFRSGHVWAQDAEHDLALIWDLDAPTHPSARLATAGPRMGDRVQNVSSPIGMWWSYASGDVAAIRRSIVNDLDAVWVQSTVPTSHGSSGCGLFDTQGYLVGLAHGGAPEAQNVSLYVHWQYLDAFLRTQGIE